jgi:preprotein translocase subunit SecB
MADNDQAAAQGEGEKKGIQPQKIYLKDVSFETPNSPGIFTLDWKPNVEIDIDNKSAVLADDLHEVVLTLTVTVKVGERTAFLAEIHQAGIFAAAAGTGEFRGAVCTAPAGCCRISRYQ